MFNVERLRSTFKPPTVDIGSGLTRIREKCIEIGQDLKSRLIEGGQLNFAFQTAGPQISFGPTSPMEGQILPISSARAIPLNRPRQKAISVQEANPPASPVTVQEPLSEAAKLQLAINNRDQLISDRNKAERQTETMRKKAGMGHSPKRRRRRKKLGYQEMVVAKAKSKVAEAEMVVAKAERDVSMREQYVEAVWENSFGSRINERSSEPSLVTSVIKGAERFWEWTQKETGSIVDSTVATVGTNTPRVLRLAGDRRVRMGIMLGAAASAFLLNPHSDAGIFVDNIPHLLDNLPHVLGNLQHLDLGHFIVDHFGGADTAIAHFDVSVQPEPTAAASFTGHETIISHTPTPDYGFNPSDGLSPTDHFSSATEPSFQPMDTTPIQTIEPSAVSTPTDIIPNSFDIPGVKDVHFGLPMGDQIKEIASKMPGDLGDNLRRVGQAVLTENKIRFDESAQFIVDNPGMFSSKLHSLAQIQLNSSNHVELIANSGGLANFGDIEAAIRFSSPISLS